MESREQEDITPEMLSALEKENVYHNYLKRLQEVDNYEEYDYLDVDYNDWTSDLDGGTDYEEDDDQEDMTFNMINETNFESIDEFTRMKMFNQICKLHTKMFEYVN